MKRLLAPLTEARTWAGSLYLLLDLPFGIAWFTILIVGLSVGVGLVVVALVGLVILAATVFAGRLIGIVERARAKALLGLDVPPPAAREKPQGVWATMRVFLADQPGWKGVGYGLLMLPVGIANFTVVVTLWSVALFGVTFPLWGWAIENRVNDTYVIEGWTKAPYIAGVFVVGVLVLWARRLLCGRWCRWTAA